jgi:multidrug resistance efflux pump
VKAGQSLVDLDPSDYEVQVAQARAAYEQALAQSAAEGPNVPITQSSCNVKPLSRNASKVCFSSSRIAVKLGENELATAIR